MSPVGMLSFTRTRFKNKETKETAYFLGRIIGIGTHTRMSDGVKASMLEEAVQTSYEKAGKETCPGECVSREIVMRHVREMKIPSKSLKEKRKSKICMLKQMRTMLLCNSMKKRGI